METQATAFRRGRSIVAAARRGEAGAHEKRRDGDLVPSRLSGKTFHGPPKGVMPAVYRIGRLSGDRLQKRIDSVNQILEGDLDRLLEAGYLRVVGTF